MKIVIITGPTATGKSDLSIYLAEKFNFEIVNFDSMQVYKYFDIGTAKPPKNIIERYPHHLLSYVDPFDSTYSAGRYVNDADKKISQIIKRGKIPLFVGGTGLYIKLLLFGIFDREENTSNFRELLKEKLQIYGYQYISTKLKIIDFKAWKKINKNDAYRTIRALDYFYKTGNLISEKREIHNFSEKRYDYLKIGIKFDRDVLYKRINMRVDRMIADGLIEETEELLKKGYENTRPMNGIGYREIKLYLKGKLKKKEEIELIKQNTRKYAKRQITWFKKENDINWIDYYKSAEILIEKFLEGENV